jgi:hypothetical protein
MTLAIPGMREQFKQAHDIATSAQQQANLQHVGEVASALTIGKPDVAIQLLTDRANALRNSGAPDTEVKAALAMADTVKEHPEFAAGLAQARLMATPGGDKVWTNIQGLAKLPGEVRKGTAEANQATFEANNTPARLGLENSYKGAQIRDLDSNIATRAGQLNLDHDKFRSETEMKLWELRQKMDPKLNPSPEAVKLINDSAIASTAAEQSANQMEDLAGRLEKEGGGYGAASGGLEWLKKATGNQDAMTQLRQEYTRMRSSQVSKMLPPGSASDKDIALAMAGFPPDTADSGTMASFMRGMAKINQLVAVSESAKSEWVNSVGHLGKPNADITIDGVKVAAGTTFPDFARKYVAAKVDQRAALAAQAQVQTRDYMRHGAPAAPTAGALGSGTFAVPGIGGQ